MSYYFFSYVVIQALPLFPMTNTRFRKILSASTVIGAFCSVGVLSAQSFVPQEQFKPFDQSQNSQIQNFEQSPQFGMPEQRNIQQNPHLTNPQQQNVQQNPQFHVPQQNPQDTTWRIPSSAPFDQPNQPQQFQYLACMQAAEARKEQVAVQLYAWMYQQNTLARQRQAQGRVAAWSIPDDRARREELRRVDNEYRDVMRAIDRQFDDVADDILDRYRDESRECKRLKNNRRPAQSSSYSSQWWQPFSSSVMPNAQGTQHSVVPTTTAGGQTCPPIVCPDGRMLPRCAPNGQPYNYPPNICTFNH